MTALFKAEEDLNAEQLLPRAINPHAQNIDPRSSTGYAGLSMQCATGLANTKVSKRKSRASRKVPIKVFSTDTTNFMAMVHSLTGFHASSYLLPGSPQSSVSKPLAMQPCHFSQGLHMPDSPAGEMTANFSNNSFSRASSQRNLSPRRKQQLDSIKDFSVCTKEGFDTFHSLLTTNRFPPYIQDPAFGTLHLQVVRNNKSSGSSSGAVFLPSQGDYMKEDCRKEGIYVASFDEHSATRGH